MFTILQFRKLPDFIASRRKLGGGMVEEEWWTQEFSKPEWWNDEFHVLKEIRLFSGVGFIKYCTQCKMKLSEKGCKHNKNDLS
jgi:hypothetical protein